MPLATNVSSLATRVATEIKSVRTLVNGNNADLSALTTTNKSSLVAALNEVKAAVSAASGINDGTTGTSSTWSSSKVASEIADSSTNDRSRANHTGTQSADTVVDGTTNKAFTSTERSKLSGIAAGATANATDAALRARSSHTGTQLASTISDLTSAIDARISNVVNGAPAALDTLDELAQAIGDDANFAGTVTAALGNRVRVDAEQTLTGTQQGQARANIAAASSADVTNLSNAVGNTETDFVAVFDAGLA